MTQREIVVMFVGPNYNGERDHARIDQAIRMAERRECPLIICGDSNGGKDLRAYARQCYERRESIDVMTLGRGKSNTRKDAIRAARLIERLQPSPTRVWLVTHWYHMPRSWIALQMRLLRSRPDVAILPLPVFADWADGFRRLPGEAKGCLDYLLGRPQRTFGKPKGKPDEEREAQKEKPPPRRSGAFLRIFSRLAQ